MATQPLPHPEDQDKLPATGVPAEGETSVPSHNKPFVVGGRGTSGGKDTTRTMVAIIVGVLILGVAFLALISTKGSKRAKADAAAAGKPSLGRVAAGPAAPGALVPEDKIAATQGDYKAGSLEAKDIEKTKGNLPQGTRSVGPTAAGLGAAGSPSTLAATSSKAGSTTVNAKNLGEITPFKQPVYGDRSQYTPPPYNGEAAANGSSSAPQQSNRADDQYTRPSMVFVAHEDKGQGKMGAQLPVEPDNFGLQSGYHVAARLESMASTALHAPVTAVIEYNYERDGQILIPAGARAVGHISQADATGIVNIDFASIEMPDGHTAAISAIAATTSLQALKGNVTGKNAGKNLAIRSLSGMGSVAAMMVGQGNGNAAISENDMLRQRAAENIGMGADAQIASMGITDHIVVSVPAGTEVYLIFTKTQKVQPGARQNIAVDRPNP